jgi:predicted ribosome quality control (RQC) complex YloA/Tae2 family protein
MALNAIDIANVLNEIAPFLVNGWIQKIQQPSDRTLIFEIRVPGATHRLLVSCEYGMTRLHVSRRPLPNPPNPPSFCQFLRAHLQGAKIDRIQQQANDRIVALHLTAKHGAVTVVCEFTGKTANVLVLDANQCILRDLTCQSRVTGKTYEPPPKHGTSKAQSTLPRFAAALDNDVFPISAAIEAYYHAKEVGQAQDRVRDERLRMLRKMLKKEQRRIEAWRGDLEKADNYRDYARYGELIKANLGSLKKGMDRIELVDYYDESLPRITIPLDTSKSAQGNMDDYFRKYRRYLAAERELYPRIVQARSGVEKLREEITAIEKGTWVLPVPTLSATRSGAHPASHKPRGGREQPRGPFRRFVSKDGILIFVGRNAQENDELTFGLAKGDDLWLHARGTPGSHVVVRLEKGKEPPPETLKEVGKAR